MYRELVENSVLLETVCLVETASVLIKEVSLVETVCLLEIGLHVHVRLAC